MDPYGPGRTAGHSPPLTSSASIPSSGTATPTAHVTPSESQTRLSHNISSFTDFNEFDSFDVYQSAAVLDYDAHEDVVSDHQPVQHSSHEPVGARVVAAYDPQPALRGRESLVSINSLVFDEALGAYTKTTPDVGTTTTPVLYTTPPPTTTPNSALQSLTSTAASALTYSNETQVTQTGSGGKWLVPKTISEPTPYSTYDSSYGSGTLSGSASHTPGRHEASTLPKPTISHRFSNLLSTRKRNLRRGSQAYGVIIEEETYDGSRESIDMASLVNNGAPVGQSSSAFEPYNEVPRPKSSSLAGDVPVDLTSFFGPSTGQDEAFIKGLQKQEASGKLTLGLGAGFGPGTKLKESDLLANASATGYAAPSSPSTIFSPISGNSLSRTFSRRWPSPSVSSAPGTHVSASRQIFRQGTVKALAQSEANRRGEIVEVIMEDEEEERTPLKAAGHAHEETVVHDGSAVDLSFMSGPEGPDPLSSRSSIMLDRRRSAIPTSKTQVFYPQPNWRPFSMRWPYLMGLIVLSVGLGIGQEFIYRMSLHRPLVKFHTPSEIDGMLYFAIKYAPTLIAVTFGILWQVTDFEVKRLEAFYQMSREGGAVADESINVDYVTYIAFLRPFRALYCKHYAVAVSSIVSLLAVSLVPTLSAASIVLTPDRKTRLADPQGEKMVVISTVWSRFLTTVFFVIAALGLLLFCLLHKRRSGLLSDVKGIAGLASMAVVSHIMTDFKGMDLASHKDIHSQLENRRYVLRNSSLAPDDENPVSLAEHERYKEFDTHMSENPHPLMLRAHGCIPYICGIILFAALIPVVLFTPANVLTDKASWVLTALAISIKLGWGGIETSVRVMEPYYILWRRHAPAKTLMLDYTAMPFVLVAVEALRNRHMLVFFVGFATIMTELLTVLVTSLATVEGHNFIGNGLHSTEDTDADSGEETALSFWVTLGLVMFILTYMSVVATVVFIRRRRPFLPRQPNTIASVLAYIHQSKMLWHFVGTSKMNNKEMLAKLEATGVTYGLGWFEGRDGKTHCGVDQEELASSYKLGYNYSMSNKPWNEEPEG